MATTDIVPQESSGELGQRRVVNDMSIQVATVNGSGSQSSNTVLLRSIFQMGVPISGKNLFPSNIAGLPTWYTIRARLPYRPEAELFTLLTAMLWLMHRANIARLIRGTESKIGAAAKA